MTSPDETQRRIAELEAELARLRGAAPPPEVAQPVSVTGGYVGQIIAKAVYGRDAEEDERRRLGWYLGALAGDLGRLSLRGLDAALAEGGGVELGTVYVTLATTERATILSETVRDDDPAQGQAIFDRYFAGRYTPDWHRQSPRLKEAFSPDHALPDAACVEQRIRDLVGDDPAKGCEVRLYRARLASEAAGGGSCVLLGEPGSGKSTFLRHLAWSLARRALDPAGAPALPGWAGRAGALPVLLSLRALAGRLAGGAPGAAAVTAALRDGLAQLGVEGAEDLLAAALASGAAVVLLDGLDEVPAEATASAAARLATLQAARAFADRHPRATVVLTCRTRAFDEGLRAAARWPIVTLAPLTLGQVRHFVPAWYGELAGKGQLRREQAERLADVLARTVAGSPKLTALAQTPLLLTLMALVLFHQGELPRDRPQLYERILDLLLGQWDQVKAGAGLADAVGLADWGSERFRPLLDRLSYEAHLAGASGDGRGRLGRRELRDALIGYFEAARVREAWAVAGRVLDYLDQRSGLLAPDGPESYVFAHLTLQEHCAGRHLALNSDDPVAAVLQYRHDDRWREPIMLAAGLLRPAELQALLAELIDGEGKAAERWQRDLILAAEVGKDRDWGSLRTRPVVKVDRLQRGLRAGLVALLGDRDQPLPVADRIRAGTLLGELGDPRFPVTIEEWAAQLRRALAGDPTGYFCRVEAGAYLIGSTDADPQANDEEKPQHTFQLEQPIWAGRLPVTNAQWQVWVAQGGQQSYAADEDAFNAPNQPVVSIDWQMANAFCAWLTEQLQGVLPPGYVVRLPTEQEWEALARGGDGRIYPWGDAALIPELAIYPENSNGRSAPVGCCPAGAARFGALDVVGNVLEWTASVWRSYPGAEKVFTEEDWRVVRGGSWRGDSSSVRCGARVRFLIVIDRDNVGFRCVVAPRLLS